MRWPGEDTPGPSNPVTSGLMVSMPADSVGRISGSEEGAGGMHGAQGHVLPVCSCLENPRDEEAWWAAVYPGGKSKERGTSLVVQRLRL